MKHEQHLWMVVDQLRANTHLRATDYALPVLGLIFLSSADKIFQRVRQQLEQSGDSNEVHDPFAYHVRGALFLEREAQYGYLLSLTDDDDRGKAVNRAMCLIEEKNSDLRGSLPTQSYTNLDTQTLGTLLYTFATLSFDADGNDDIGRVYEYFLGQFALKEGQGGGEFYTPASLVRLIVEIIEPFSGLVFDPACGSGGMFVQSARFMQRRQRTQSSNAISLYGMEKSPETANLCKINLAVHGLCGDIKVGNSYYEDYHSSDGRYDFIMANPPWNVKGVERTRLLPNWYLFGIPRVNNGNYLWIQMFYAALNERGRAGFVMSNGAATAGGSEQEIRQRLIEDRVVDVMIAVGSHFFYNTAVPCTLWFFDKEKRNSERGNRVLFIDARDIFRQIDRVHREFTDQQIEYLANIVRLYRGQQPEYEYGSEQLVQESFPDSMYGDVSGRCKVATVEEIAAQDWSLNPGVYVGSAVVATSNDRDFSTKIQELYCQWERQNAEAHILEVRIRKNMTQLLGEKAQQLIPDEEVKKGDHPKKGKGCTCKNCLFDEDVAAFLNTLDDLNNYLEGLVRNDSQFIAFIQNQAAEPREEGSHLWT